jgi:alpha-ribazole phosphatase
VRWPGDRRLVLMRHGETYEPRLETAMAGPEEDPALPLTERGRARLREVGRWLANHPLDAAWASPYRRAQDTARLVVEPQGIPVGTLEPLAELPLHPPGGGTVRDVARRYLALVRALEERPPHAIALDDGRSLGAIVDAALDAVRGVLEQGERTVLVVAHGGINRFLLGHWLGMPPARAIAIEQSFACVNVVEFTRGGVPWVRTLNATLHDPLKLSAPGI